MQGYKKVQFAPEFQVSRSGKVLRNGKPQKVHRRNNGYDFFNLPKKYSPSGKQQPISIARLVAFVWNNREDEFFNSNLHVHHRNGVKSDNRISNLVICTCKEHGFYHDIHREYMRYIVTTKKYKEYEKARLQDFLAKN